VGEKKCRISVHILQTPQDIVLKYVTAGGFFVLLLADLPIVASAAIHGLFTKRLATVVYGLCAYEYMDG
jgi:hypothetical protein